MSSDLAAFMAQVAEVKSVSRARGTKAGTPLSAGVEVRDGREFTKVVLAPVKRPNSKARHQSIATKSSQTEGWAAVGLCSGDASSDQCLWRMDHRMSSGVRKTPSGQVTLEDLSKTELREINRLELAKWWRETSGEID